ncbi:MAG TPA: cell division protein SepF [Candidatus Nitrosotenuis sp.]|jgi:cell division inhibitor SepF|nr:cell division protein SepF [Candidatus Nitrosotenuis sp.]
MAGLMEKIRSFFTLEEEAISSEESLSESASGVSARREKEQQRPRGTLISLPSPRKQEVVILEPGTFAEAREIAEALKAKKCIILNMRRTDKELSRRIVDFLSGISYALDGYTQKVADQIYLFTPSHIEIFVPDRQLAEASAPAGVGLAEAGSGG